MTGVFLDRDTLDRHDLDPGCHLDGAGIDVLETGPSGLTGDIPNLIVTPHIVWASREARQRLADQLTDNILAFLACASQNLVIPH